MSYAKIPNFFALTDSKQYIQKRLYEHFLAMLQYEWVDPIQIQSNSRF